MSCDFTGSSLFPPLIGPPLCHALLLLNQEVFSKLNYKKKTFSYGGIPLSFSYTCGAVYSNVGQVS